MKSVAGVPLSSLKADRRNDGRGDEQGIVVWIRVRHAGIQA
jgi:hypothetical protein